VALDIQSLRSVVLPGRQLNLTPHLHLKRLPCSGAFGQYAQPIHLINASLTFFDQLGGAILFFHYLYPYYLLEQVEQMVRMVQMVTLILATSFFSCK
jgi:hypothetical protein